MGQGEGRHGAAHQFGEAFQQVLDHGLRDRSMCCLLQLAVACRTQVSSCSRPGLLRLRASQSRSQPCTKQPCMGVSRGASKPSAQAHLHAGGHAGQLVVALSSCVAWGAGTAMMTRLNGPWPPSVSCRCQYCLPRNTSAMRH